MSTPTTRRGLREQALASGAPATAPVPAAPRRRAGIGRVLGDLGLWLAAAAGAICIVLVILAITAGITLIMFRTGSMSPSIPAGSVAIVQRVDATQVRVGDVVTVDRDDELPITHRVTSIEAGATDAERIITMRGDANAVDDPFPYTVTSVRTVLFSIPGIATVIAGMGNPWVLGGLTAGATILVIWAFWPRAGSSTTRRQEGLT